MDSDDAECLENAQQLQNSQDSFEFLDWEQPPVWKAPKCSTPSMKYASQLFLPKRSQSKNNSSIDTNSNIDSGFDSQQSSSSIQSQMCGQLQSIAKQNQNLSQQFELFDVQSFTQRIVSTQSTISLSDSPFDSLSTLSTLSSFETQGNTRENTINHEHKEQNDLEMLENDANVEKEAFSPSTNKDTYEAHQPPINPEESLSFSIGSKIEPIFTLHKHITSQNTGCAFVFALAAHMCKDIYPENFNISFKTALLLSIVSCNAKNDAQPISIMAIARDSAAASSIMGSIGNLATRFICINDDLKLNGKHLQTKTIEANSLMMARNGVGYIGDWLGLKPASLNYLQNVIDSGRVTADSSSNIEYALNCAVWMYWSCSAKKFHQNKKDLSMISKLFGIPVVLDESPSQEVIDFIFDKYTTKRASEEEEDESAHNQEYDGIDENAIKEYLNVVADRSVEFNIEALSLLKLYFIVTRATRPNILTPNSFVVLRCLSECHAKLCLQSEVQKTDVIFSIELFEQFVLKFFAGQVTTKPMPNTSPSNFQQVDEHMNEFAQWLDGYLCNINENVLTFFQEN